MGKRALGVIVLSFAVLAGCGTDAEAPGTPAPTEVTDPTAEGTDTSPEPTTPETSDAAPPEGGEEPTVLFGSVGTEEDPEAFVINLTDESGETVTSLPAGDYTIEVTDPAEMHNFHLIGDSVDEMTTVPGTENATFEVTLEPGEYTYRCDPHPPMTGTFTVT
jgi:hypothetical protein